VAKLILNALEHGRFPSAFSTNEKRGVRLQDGLENMFIGQRIYVEVPDQRLVMQFVFQFRATIKL